MDPTEQPWQIQTPYTAAKLQAPKRSRGMKLTYTDRQGDDSVRGRATTGAMKRNATVAGLQTQPIANEYKQQGPACLENVEHPAAKEAEADSFVPKRQRPDREQCDTIENEIMPKLEFAAINLSDFPSFPTDDIGFGHVMENSMTSKILEDTAIFFDQIFPLEYYTSPSESSSTSTCSSPPEIYAETPCTTFNDPTAGIQAIPLIFSPWPEASETCCTGGSCSDSCNSHYNYLPTPPEKTPLDFILPYPSARRISFPTPTSNYSRWTACPSCETTLPFTRDREPIFCPCGASFAANINNINNITSQRRRSNQNYMASRPSIGLPNPWTPTEAVFSPPSPPSDAVPSTPPPSIRIRPEDPWTAPSFEQPQGDIQRGVVMTTHRRNASGWFIQMLDTLQCGYCGEAFPQLLTLQAHLNQTRKHDVWGCCGRFYKKKQDLMQHEERVHGKAWEG